MITPDTTEYVTLLHEGWAPDHRGAELLPEYTVDLRPVLDM